MKRISFLLLTLVVFAFPAFAQNTALSPEQEEKLNRLTSDIETLTAANAELLRKISALTEEVARLREEQSRSANSGSTEALREDVRKLAEKLQEVDRKRVADNREIAEQVEELGKLLKSAAAKAQAQARVPREITPEPPAASDKPGLTYVVKAGDTLSEIVQAANAHLAEKGMKKVTLQQVLEANPGLKPTSMKIGQKILIPMESK